ncbi:MAG: tetratricopeptide repeat protein, partial [Acidobacteria bacterium]|nr:tetratricopeptide repeat protein [Acidobacteriota bacterium]
MLAKLGPLAGAVFVGGTSITANALADIADSKWGKAAAGMLNELAGGKIADLLGSASQAFAPGRDPDLENALKAAFAEALRTLEDDEHKDWFQSWQNYLKATPAAGLFTSDGQPTELVEGDQAFQDLWWTQMEVLLLRWAAQANTNLQLLSLESRKHLPEPLRTRLRNELPERMRQARDYVERDPDHARARIATQQRFEHEVLERLQPQPAPTADWNFQSPVQGFFPRDELVQQIDQALAASPTTVLTALHGLGGIGKTQLALHYAASRRQNYKFGAMLDASSQFNLQESLYQLGRHLGLPDATREEMVQRTLATLCQREPWLLLLDNIESEEDFRHWRGRFTGRGHVLLTSRSELWGNSAHAVPVTTLSEVDGAKFLLERTGSQDQAGAQALTRELDGLILALEHAAAWMRASERSIAEYRQIWRERLDKLPRHTDYLSSVAAAIGLSLDRLAERSPLAFDLLSLFALLSPSQIPKQQLLVAGAEALPAELRRALDDRDLWGEVIEALAQGSLVRRVEDAALGRGYVVHRLVQQCMRERLAPADRDRWFTVACDVIGKAFPEDADQPDHWPACKALLPHLQMLREETSSAGASPSFARGLNLAGGGYLRQLGAFIEARDLLELALESDLRQFGPDHPNVAAHRSNLATILRALGEHQAARQQIELALESALRQFGPDHPNVAVARSNLANILRALGEHQAARHQIELALESDLRQ